MISFQYLYNTSFNATNGGSMEAQSKAMNEIQFKDIEIKSFSGWLGLFLHLIVVPAIGLLCFVLYAFGGGGVALGGFLQLIIAVGMVELALDQLSIKGIIELAEDKKATMVSNLLVVLCSETDTTPVVNTGSLYQ